jgi:hypothetical protein
MLQPGKIAAQPRALLHHARAGVVDKPDGLAGHRRGNKYLLSLKIKTLRVLTR